MNEFWTTNKSYYKAKLAHYKKLCSFLFTRHDNSLTLIKSLRLSSRLFLCAIPLIRKCHFFPSFLNAILLTLKIMLGLLEILSNIMTFITRQNGIKYVLKCSRDF